MTQKNVHADGEGSLKNRAIWPEILAATATERSGKEGREGSKNLAREIALHLFPRKNRPAANRTNGRRKELCGMKPLRREWHLPGEGISVCTVSGSGGILNSSTFLLYCCIDL